MSRNDRSRDRPAVDDLIDQNVRLLYDGLIAEGLPDRFKELLNVIRAEDHQQGNLRDDDA
ncbi:MAG: NepR family anti-sigma factor [Pseudomonadota bacterium]